MKIEILDASDPVHGTPYVLVAGGLDSPEDFAVNAEDMVQLLESVRAPELGVRNRGNRRHNLTFQLTRGYADIPTAEQALLDHPAEVPTEGTIRLTVEGTGTPAVRYLYNATVHAFAAQQIGCAILWRYTLTGGQLGATAPTDPDTSDTMKAQIIDLTAGDVEKTFSFDTPFATAPRGIFPSLLIPTGGAGFAVWINKDTLTAEGGKLLLGAAVPASPSGYQVSLTTLL